MHATKSNQAAAFGAALTALALAESPANGAILALTTNPSSQRYSTSAGGGYVKLSNTVTAGPGTFFQFNNNFAKSLRPGNNSFSWRPVAHGSPITAGQAFVPNLIIGTAAAGTHTYAFVRASNEVGWVRMNLGGARGDIIYLAAAWDNTPSGNIIAGTLNPVPEPTSLVLVGLAALAIGAGFIRNRRKASVKF